MDKFCEDCIHNEVCQYGAIPPHIGRCNDKDTLDDLRPQGTWILVSERLPKERIDPTTNTFENVLCSTIWGDVRTYKFGKPKGYNEGHFWHHGMVDECVIAWQYAPEPYKEGGAEND